LDFELLVVSPLKRALITTTISFQHLNQTNHNITKIVHPLVRERLENGCDIGTPLSIISKEFPGFEYHESMKEVWWYAPFEYITVDNYKEIFRNERYEESFDLLRERIEEFKIWLKNRPEKTIVVVGHSCFFQVWLNSKEKLNNCEIFETYL